MKTCTFSFTLPIPTGMRAVRHKWLLVIVVLALLQAACSSRTAEMTTIPESLMEPVTVDPKPMSPGTLWNGDEGNWLADIKARRVGDIVTVIIVEKAKASKEASTDTDRSSSMTAGISALFGYEKVAEELNPNLNTSSMVDATMSNKFSGGGKTTRSENLAATLTTQVIEVYPNGNMKIRGGKSVTVNTENQIIYLTGIVRAYDVTAENTIDSGNILNAQIAYTGKGALSDKQKPGWLMRIFDHTWPF